MTTNLPEAQCPHCGNKMEKALDFDMQDTMPVAGDCTVCQACGGMLRFDEYLQMRPWREADMGIVSRETYYHLRNIQSVVMEKLHGTGAIPQSLFAKMLEQRDQYQTECLNHDKPLSPTMHVYRIIDDQIVESESRDIVEFYTNPVGGMLLHAMVSTITDNPMSPWNACIVSSEAFVGDKDSPYKELPLQDRPDKQRGVVFSASMLACEPMLHIYRLDTEAKTMTLVERNGNVH